ncbi:MAG: serine/threonine-protein kinase [Terriglobia bacterium]
MQRLGRYEILEVLGQGAMGTVHRARDPQIDRIVALKTISVVGTAEEVASYRERFFREAQAAGKLSHPGIVTIHDIGHDDATDTPFIVMEFLEGKTVEEVGRGPRMGVEPALNLVQQLAEALDYAHGQGIVHRDIKPANVIITCDGRAKITDFGIAKLQSTQFTRPGQLLGTPAYMSPEQVNGGVVDGRSDLFSLGVIFYWLLTGEKPFTGDTVTSISFQIVYKDPPQATRINPALSPHHDSVVQRALAKSPQSRYQTGREFANDLDDLRHRSPPRCAAQLSSAGAVENTIAAEVPVEATMAQQVSVTPAVSAGEPQALAWKRFFLAVGGLLAAFGRFAWEGARRFWVWAGPLLLKLAPTLAQGARLLGRGTARFLRWAGPLLLTLARGLAQEARLGWQGARRFGAWAKPMLLKIAQEIGEEIRRGVGAARRLPYGGVVLAVVAFALLVGLITVPLLYFFGGPAATSTLQVTCKHNFHSAEFSLWVDDDLTYTTELTGAEKTRLGVFTTVGGSFSEILRLPPGHHVLRVRVTSPTEGFDQTREIEGDFADEGKRALYVGFGRRSGNLFLTLSD